MADDPIPLFNLHPSYEVLKPRIHQAVLETLNSGKWILGPQTQKFETEFADLIGVKHCITCSSACAALQIALQAAGIKPGDEVITSPFAPFFVTEAISAAQARFVFADIDARAYTLDVHDAERKITKHTQAILPIHLFGYPANMEAIMHLANEHGLKVIEDCSQAHLAQAEGVYVGGIGTAGVFSFSPFANLASCSHAGCITTNDDELAEKARSMRKGETLPGACSWAENSLYMDEIQAAILCTKLPFLEEWTDARRKAAAWYEEELAGVPVVLPPAAPPGWNHAFSLYTIRADKRNDLMAFLQRHNIECAVFYPAGLYSQPKYAGLKINPTHYPQTQKACQEVLSLPMFPEITPEQIQRVCSTIRDFYEEQSPV